MGLRLRTQPVAGVLVIFCRFGLDWAGLDCGLPRGSGYVHLTISQTLFIFLNIIKQMRMRMIWFKHLILKGLRTVGLMIVHSVHLNTFVLRNLVSFKIPFTDGVVSRDHRSSAQLHLHSGQLSINFDLKLLNSWESFTLLLFNHSTPNIYLFYYSSLERSHLPAKTRKIGHKILWIWATIKHSLYKENCS